MNGTRKVVHQGTFLMGTKLGSLGVGLLRLAAPC